MQERSSGKPFIGTLHGLRGAMAVWVVLHHYSPRGLGPIQIPRYGYLGVDVFFILSGFVLYLNHRQDLSQLNHESAFKFLATRFWRTYPLFFVTFLCSLAVFIWLRGHPPLIGQFLSSLLLLEGWLAEGMRIDDPVWSLGVEWVGYAAFPLLALVVGRAGRRSGCIAMAALMAGFVLLANVLPVGWDMTEGWCAIIRMGFEVAAGSLSAALFALQPASLKARGDVIFAIGCAGLGVGLVAGLLTSSMPFLVLIVYGTAASGPVCVRVLANPLTLFLGKVSFGLYLIHKIVEVVFSAIFAHQASLAWRIGTTLFLIGTSLGIATMLFHFVERPVQQWRRRRRSAVARGEPLGS